MRAQEFINEEKVRLDPSCWDNKKIGNPKTKVKGGVRVNNCVPKESVAEGEQSDLRKLQQQWWVALPAIMKKAGLDYQPVKELSRDYYPTLGWIKIPGEQFTTFDVNANPKGDAAKINISVDVDTSNEFYRTAQPERAAKLNAVAEKIAQALGGTAAEHMTGQRKNHPGVSRITATMTLPKEPAEWQNPSRSYDPRARFLNTPGERARQSRAARSGFPDSYGGDASNYRLEEGADQRKQNALWAQITAHEKAAKKSKDLKQQHHLKMADQLRSQLKTSDDVAEGEVVQFPKKHKGDLDSIDSCVKCHGDLQGGTYMGHKVKVCIPCKQVYLPPNSNIDQQGNKIEK